MAEEQKIYWTRSAHCTRCRRGFPGEGGKKKAEACYDLGAPEFKYAEGDHVTFRGKAYRWVITAVYYRNAVSIARSSGNVKPAHVKCYSLKGFDHPWLKKACITESALKPMF